ncbi:hypothetical protein O2K51_06155 [Apibacter raozihei]|uniref:hypothetical protein n=1 Tax=Apibacter raozihei TaxID=2500547 RepID=UPI000FE372CF|nr:hypothetical protein [Apibacter raozihei]
MKKYILLLICNVVTSTILCNSALSQVLISTDPSIVSPSGKASLELTPTSGSLPYTIRDFKRLEVLAGDQPIEFNNDTKTISILNAAGQKYESKYFTSSTTVDSYTELGTNTKSLNTPFMPYGGGSNSTYTTTYGGCVQMNAILIPNDTSCKEQIDGSDYTTPGYQKAKLGTDNDIIKITTNFPQKLFTFIFINGTVYPNIESIATGAAGTAGQYTNIIRDYLSSISYPDGNTKEYWLSGSVNGTWTGYSQTFYDNQGSYANGYIEDHGPTVLSEIVYSYDDGATWYHGGIMQNSEFTKGAPINITLAGAIDIPQSVFPNYPDSLTDVTITLKVIHHARTRGHSGTTGQVYGGPISGRVVLNDAYTFRVNSVNTLVEYKVAH